MYPKTDEGPAQAQPPATGVPMSGAYYQQSPAAAPVAKWSTGLFHCFDDCSNQLHRDVPVPVHHVRTDRGDRRRGLHVVRLPRGAVHGTQAAHGLPALLLLRLPRQDARALRPAREPLRRLLRPLLLRAVRPLPDVPRAHQQVLRREPGTGWQANLERQGRTAATVPPPMHTGMTR